MLKSKNAIGKKIPEIKEIIGMLIINIVRRILNRKNDKR